METLSLPTAGSHPPPPRLEDGQVQLISTQAAPEPPTTPTSVASTPTSTQNFTTPKGDEIGLLKHQVRLLKAENLNLKEKLGTKQNFVPFNESLPRKPSLVGDSLHPSSPPFASSSSRRPPSRNSTSPEHSNHRSVSPLPGSVSLTRALISNDGTSFQHSSNLGASTSSTSSYIPDHHDSDLSASLSQSTSGRPPLPSTSSSSSSTRNGTRSSHSSLGPSAATENPFFGSGASRERIKASATSAASGSGKVISGLQSELLSVRSALDSARAQLRLSQKAVEHLTRQNEELKAKQSQLSTESSSLNKMISRKERTHTELTSRALTAEASLASLQESHTTLAASHSSELADLNRRLEEAEGRRGKAESEYGALREGMKSMAEGWRRELEWVKEGMVKVEERGRRELDEVKAKHAALHSLFQARETEHASVAQTLATLTSSHTAFMERYSDTHSELVNRLNQGSTVEVEALERAKELEGDFKRLRRMIKEHGEKG